MSSGIAVTNTLAFLFPDNAAQPTLEEMVRFVKELAGDQTKMDTAYKNAELKTVFIKFKSEEGMQEALALNRKKLPFHYSSGAKVDVSLSVAGSNVQYVRVFDLPPEVSDHDLSLEFSKYGKIKRFVREKYPPEHQLDLFTGVRGIYMDVEKAIPSALYFQDKRDRIFYNGNKLKCFVCGQEGHQKVACGKRKSKPTRKTEAGAEKNSTFATVLAGTSASDKQTVDLEIEVLEELEKEAEEEEDVVASPTTTLDNGKQQNKQQQQQQKHSVLHYQQRSKQTVGNWTEYVKIHTKLMKDQQKQFNENSPPRKTLRPNSPRSGAGSE